MTRILKVNRVISATPLASVHAEQLARGPQRPKRSVNWEDFDPGRYSKRALALAADQTKTLAEGEYGAVGLFGQLASALALNQAPFDIIAQAATISSDEIRHADYCTQFAERCSGHSLELEVDGDEVLRASKNLSEIEQLDHFILKYSAIGETLAGALLTECRRRASDPVARQLYTSLAADEVHHARLGWYYFAWRAPQWSHAEKQRLADRIAAFVMELECYFWTGRDAPKEASNDAAALGVLDSPSQRAVIQSVMESEICPGLDAIGLGGSRMWERRRRATVAASSQPAPLVLTKPVGSEELAVRRGAEWLARAVGGDGSLRLTLDLNDGVRQWRGDFYHGRAAVVLMALERVGYHAETAQRLRAFLQAELDALARGRTPDAWPEAPRAVAGTLALLELSGIHHGLLEPSVDDFDATAESAWHAAQVVCALGARAPDDLWEVCRSTLRGMPWASWTALAARARDDQATLARAVRNLQSALSPLGTEGECPAPGLPLALVAAAAEALLPESSGEAQERVAACRRYLLRWQIGYETADAVRDRGLGAFPLLPNDTILRADVTAHALLALVRS